MEVKLNDTVSISLQRAAYADCYGYIIGFCRFLFAKVVSATSSETILVKNRWIGTGKMCTVLILSF